MKAVRYKGPSPITHPDSLVDIDLPTPVSGGRDLLVEVRAVSVNPVDVKLRASAAPLKGDTYRVLGFDASGVVREAGPQATRADALVERWFSPDSSDGTCASFRLSSQHARSTRGAHPPEWMCLPCGSVVVCLQIRDPSRKPCAGHIADEEHGTRTL
jgi:NADPH:quinone reductase-like Zn-dependent oxidoreductase